MFPYFEQPVLVVGSLRLHAFGLLVGLAVLIGSWLFLRRADRVGMDPNETTGLLLWGLVVGFLVSHLESLAVNEPWLFTRVSSLWDHPWRWLNLWDGMSAFGGILGGVLGGWLYVRRHRWPQRMVRLHFDALAFAFPFAWAIARFGCYLAHDHPGIRTSSWLAVQYPDGPRYDLGLFDSFLAIAIALFFVRLDRKPRVPGFFLTAFLLTYGPARLALDTLRDEERWAGLTSGQYGGLLATILGAVLWRLWLHPASHPATRKLENSPESGGEALVGW